MTTAQQLRQVRSALEQARELLETPTPTVLERCAASLETAAAQMHTVEARLRVEQPLDHPNVVPGLRLEIEFVRRELRTLSALLEQAAAFHMSWAAMAGLVGAGYTASGRPAAPDGRKLIAIQG